MAMSQVTFYTNEFSVVGTPENITFEKVNDRYVFTTEVKNNETDITEKIGVTRHKFQLPNTTTGHLVNLNFNRSIVLSSVEGSEYNGCSWALFLEETEYSLSSDGVPDPQLISDINAYKGANGKFPDVTLLLTTWVFRQAKTSSVEVTLDPVSITYELDGGTTILRPVADISAGHTIPSGYSGVYQLINETTADDFATYISSISDAANSYQEVDLTSTVSLSSLPLNSRIVHMRLVAHSAGATAAVVGTTNRLNVEVYCPEYAYSICTLTRSSLTNSAFVAFSEDTSATSFYEKYLKRHRVPPQLCLSLNTYAQGSSGKSDPANVDITQAYVEVVYEAIELPEVYYKDIAEWKYTTSFYRKVNGVWEPISLDTCKRLLAENYCVRPLHVTVEGNTSLLLSPLSTVSIKGDTKLLPNNTLNLLCGTILECSLGIKSAAYEAALFINGELKEVVKSEAPLDALYGKYVTFDYVITKDVTITCEKIDADGDGTADYGNIYIVEH